MPTRPYRLSILQTKAARNISDLRDKILTKYNLTSSEWQVLGLVNFHGKEGITAGEIAAELDIVSTYVTSIIRILKTKKLLQQTTSNRDRRVKVLTVTKAGGELASSAEAELEAAIREVNKIVSIDKFNVYLDVLEKLSGDMLKKMPTK